MKLAYLLNTHPIASTTFIRREIAAIEALGTPVKRFAIRHWETRLVDPDDQAEQQRTDYLLTGPKGALLKDVLACLLRHPLRLLAVLPLWLRLLRNAGGVVAHVAYLIEAMAFERRATRAGVTHVHAHFSTNSAAVALLSHRLGGPSYSFTVHGPDELVDPRSLSLAEKARYASFIVAISNYCRARILKEAPMAADKVEVIRCGIDLDRFVFRSEPPPGGRVICVGRLCHNKGQKHLPAAIARVKDEFPDLVVELIGGGPDEALIRAEIERHGVGEHILLRGWGTGDQIKASLAEARALILPSYAEGLPIALMESFAIGRPVLTTRITGIPELVDSSCGWLFEPGDVEAIAEALRAVMRTGPEARAAMGGEGRRRIEQWHDVRKSARALLDAFQPGGSPATSRA